MKTEFDTIDAVSIGSVTLVGYIKYDYPMKRGNCFSMFTEDKTEFKIVNFWYENLKKLLDDKVLEFPVKISKISDSHAIMCDERIPFAWYNNNFCQTCTPRNLWPTHQLLERYLDIKNGKIVETVVEKDGQSFMITKINNDVPEGLIFVPYIVQSNNDVI